MAGPIRVFAQYAEWPPVGEVVLSLGDLQVRLNPENADIVGSALLEFSATARAMTQDVADNPGLAEGIWTTGGGGRA